MTLTEMLRTKGMLDDNLSHTQVSKRRAEIEDEMNKLCDRLIEVEAMVGFAERREELSKIRIELSQLAKRL